MTSHTHTPEANAKAAKARRTRLTQAAQAAGYSSIDRLAQAILRGEIAMSTNYGKVNFNGKTYRLDNQAELTNRVFPGWWGDAEEGESYTAEWAADAADEQGQDCKVVWQWQEIKGEELEDAGNYPWDDDQVDHIVEQ
jgi:hypothetical protein